MSKRRKLQNAKCPKCSAMLFDGEWRQYCRRCGYSKNLEADNLSKKLFGSFNIFDIGL